MPPEMKPVFSSHIESVGYEGDTLYVQWTSGKTSAYKGVPADTAITVMNSWSVGEAVRDMVKGTYEHEYVS
jgi:hypothetical protein